MKTRRLWHFAGVLAVGLVACGDFADEPVPEAGAAGPTGTSQLSLVVASPAEAGVAALRISIERVPCGAEDIEPLAFSVDLPLEGPMPGDLVPAAADAGLDPASAYHFADAFWAVPAGCYDVSLTALDADSQPAAACSGATLPGVVVEDGATSEVVLVSECQLGNDPVGGLDVVGSLELNRPPQILEDGETFWPSKFDNGCHGVEVCVAASDPDGDPLVWEWEQIGGGRLFDRPVVLRTDTVDGHERQCVGIVAAEVGTFSFRVTVWDLHEGVLDPESRDELEFPLYAIGDCL